MGTRKGQDWAKILIIPGWVLLGHFIVLRLNLV